MKPWAWILIAGLAARAALIAWDPAPAGLKPLEPSVIAERLNTGRGFTFEQYGAVYRAWKEPLYIVLLAGLTRFTGDHPLPIIVFQSLCGLGAALGVAWLARQVFRDEAKAAAAGVIAAINPFLVYYDTQMIHPLSFDVLWFLLVTGSVLIAVRDGGFRRSAAAGLLMGVALWQRAVLMACGIGAWAAAWITTPSHRARIMRLAAVWMIVAAAVIAPWLLRNARLFDRVVMTTDTGHIFWLGNNPHSNGTYSDQQGRRVIGLADPAFVRRIQQASEIEQHDLFFADARCFIREQPAAFARLVLGRLWAFVWFSPNAGVEYTPQQGTLYRAAYLLLLSLGIMGVARWWPRAPSAQRRVALLLLGSVAGLAAAHALTAINLKHRVPLELLLAVFAAESLSAGWTRLRTSVIIWSE